MVTIPIHLIILILTVICLGFWFYNKAKKDNLSFYAIGIETWLIGILMIIIFIGYALYFWIK